MKKTVIACAFSAAIFAGTASAAPLTDYTAGKTNIDLTWRNTEITGNVFGLQETFDKKSSLDWGITTGVGNNFAIQYRQFNPKTKSLGFNSTVHGNPAKYTFSAKLDTQEFNLLYKVDKNVAVYAGIMQTKAHLDVTLNTAGTTESGSISSDNKTRWQIGAVGSTKLADKTTAYASLAAGKNLTSWELGIAQEVAPNVDLNISYREIKANKNNVSDLGSTDVDATAKGLGFGVSYKF